MTDSFDDASTLRTLSRHAARRAQGLATVSLLSMPEADGRRLWSIVNPGRPIADVSADGLGSAHSSAMAVFNSVAAVVDLVEFSAAELARRKPVAIDRPTVADWQAAWADFDDDVATVARAICVASSTRSDWIDPLLSVLPPVEATTAFARLIPPPPLFVTGLTGRIAAAAGGLSMIAQSAPHWPIAGVVTPEAVAALRVAGPADRGKSLLLGGVVSDVDTLEPDAAEPDAGDADVRPPTDDEARSAAERTLYNAVQADPLTAGLFRLNVPLDFRFGTRPAEADLFASTYNLVVEVDGYYHFGGPDAFNRDRRKDWQLQQHQYRFYRVLADDVHADVSAVLDRIKLVLQDCRRKSQGGS